MNPPRPLTGITRAPGGGWRREAGTASLEIELRPARWIRVVVFGSADPPAAVSFAPAGRPATELGVLDEHGSHLSAHLDTGGATSAELRIHGDAGVAVLHEVRTEPALRLLAVARAFLLAARHHRARGGDLPRLVLRAVRDSLRLRGRASWRGVQLVQRDIVAAPAVYRLWWERTRRRSEARGQRISDVRSPVTVSLLVPVYDTPEPWLRRCIDSVLAQTYPRWELCIANDASTAPHVRPILDALAAADERVRLVHRERNGNIVAASNSALELASGGFVGLLDHDDELAPSALLESVLAIDRQPDIDLVYSDEDKIDDRGEHFEPYFKPDWSPELLLTHMYTAHFSVYRRALLLAAGAFRAGTDGSQDYDLALRVTDRTSRVAHIPKVLYHWRIIPGSTAGRVDAKTFRYGPAARALELSLDRRGARGRVEALVDPPSYFRVHHEPSARSVSAIVFGPDAEQTARALTRQRSELQVLPAIVASADPRAIGAAAAGSAGELLLFLDGALELPRPGWLERMAGYAERTGVGIIGCRIVSRNGLVEESGLFVNAGRIVGAHAGYPATSHGYMGRLVGSSDCTAVSRCFLMTRATFDTLGGLDEGLADLWEVGTSIRALEAGLRVVCLADVVAGRRETGPRRTERVARSEIEAILARRRDGCDPYYNPNLDPSGDFSLAWPP